MILSSPAKINLSLDILKKRADGYHDIETSFQYIDLYDYMSFEKTDDDICIESNRFGNPTLQIGCINSHPATEEPNIETTP